MSSVVFIPHTFCCFRHTSCTAGSSESLFNGGPGLGSECIPCKGIDCEWGVRGFDLPLVVSALLVEVDTHLVDAEMDLSGPVGLMNLRCNAQSCPMAGLLLLRASMGRLNKSLPTA